MKNFKSEYIFKGLIFSCLIFFLGLYIGSEIPWGSNFVGSLARVAYTVFVTVAFLSLVLYTIWEIDERAPQEYEELLKKQFLPVRFPKLAILVLALVILGHRAYLASVDMKRLHNTNVVYVNDYQKVTSSLTGLYDLTWKTYAQKWQIADSAKATGMELTKLIYENKKDASSVSMKLIVENKLVPLEAITEFYSDLSSYIEKKRDQYYGLELQRQQIVANQGVLLETFPNNVYNILLNIKKIEYKYGFLSDSTNQVFDSGVENLK